MSFGYVKQKKVVLRGPMVSNVII